MSAPFSREEVERYSRHMLIPEVGKEGQAKLKEASVLVVGAGGLGCPALLYLAAAGVGKLGIVDFDRVDATNLHRQILHGTSDVGRDKTESARTALLEINPHVEVVLHDERLTSQNALEILAGYDVVLDGTDNFPTRYLVNDACVLLEKPNVHGSIFRFDGQASVFAPSLGGPCYRCLYPEPPPPGTVPSCAEGGVLGVLPGIVGVIQATETVKLLLGIGDSLVGRLLVFNALEMRFLDLRLRRDPQCPLCGDAPTVTSLIDYEGFCGMGASGQVDEVATLEPGELARRIEAKEDFILLDVRESHEAEICSIGGSRLVPLGRILSELSSLDPAATTVVYCKIGLRGEKAARLLRDHGFTRVENLRGGITAWAEEVDPEMARY